MVRISLNGSPNRIAGSFASLYARKIVDNQKIPTSVLEDFGKALKRGDLDLARLGQRLGYTASLKPGRHSPIQAVSCRESKDPVEISLMLINSEYCTITVSRADGKTQGSLVTADYVLIKKVSGSRIADSILRLENRIITPGRNDLIFGMLLLANLLSRHMRRLESTGE